YSLAFLAWLEGLRVAQAQGPDGGTLCGVGDASSGTVCWLGAQEWRVSGTAGEQLGLRLWKTFLRAGGPRPTEVRIQARPCGAEPPATEGARLCYRRRGPHFDQTWTLPASWERSDRAL